MPKIRRKAIRNGFFDKAIIQILIENLANLCQKKLTLKLAIFKNKKGWKKLSLFYFLFRFY